MKLARPILLLVCFLLTGWLSLPKAALATTQTDGDLQVTSDSPLFPPSVLWYPGLEQTKTITVTNFGSATHTVYVQALNTLTTAGSDYPTVLLFGVSEKGVVRYGSGDTSLQDFWNAGAINLSDLAGGAATNYDVQISLPSSAGNSYQRKTAIFDLRVGFAGTSDQVTVSGGGGGGGGNPSAPVCNDTKPGSAPTLTSVVAGVNSVTLFWTTASDPVTYYLVTYGASSGAQTYGNPNVGGQGTTSYTVSGLSGGTTYYFKVRAGNGCMPGDYSNELSAAPLGGFLAGPAAGFAPGVLGEATPSAQATPSAAQGEVQGEATSNPVSPEPPGFPGLWVLLLFLLLLAAFVYVKRRRNQ